MRVKIRETVGFDNSVNPDNLKYNQMILLAIVRRYRKSKHYRDKLEASLGKESKERIAREERLKEELFTLAYKSLKEPIMLGDTLVEADKVVLSVSREMESELLSIKKHKEFVDYTIRILECDRDLLKCFPDLRIRVEISRKRDGN